MKIARFYLAKMDCPTEERLIRDRLGPMPEVDRLEFDLMQQQLKVMHRLEEEAPLLQALQALGMGPQLLEAEGAKAPPIRHGPSLLEWIVLAVAGGASLAAEGLALSGSGEGSPTVMLLSVMALLLSGREPLRKALIALRNRTMNINALMTVAVLGAVAIGEWPEAAMVTFLFAVAELIESYSLDRARNAIRELIELTPDRATVLQPDGAWREVEAATVAAEQVVRVRPGERIPLDGIVTAGGSSVNQAPITGESIPVEKGPGDTVFAGSVNERGSLEFRVTAAFGNTTLARIIRSVQAAQAEHAPTQRFIDAFARWYTPAVVVLAFLAASIPPLAFGEDFRTWLYRALVLLVISCPCALVISTPVTVVSGLAAAARRGLLIKGGVYLEEGKRLRVVALDKTGTITRGRPEVTDVVPLDGSSEERALEVSASLDALSEHPVAAAIVQAWSDRQGSPLLPVEDFASLTGRGVRGRIGDRTYHLGNHRLAEEAGYCSPEAETHLRRFEEEGKTAVLLGSEGRPLAVLAVADTVRAHSAEAVAALQAQGVHVVLLTGDNSRTAAAIGRSVGILDARGDLLPDEKLEAVKRLVAEHGHAGMVGDGINDAPALAAASVGFAMGGAGTDTAIETADVALMRDDLRLLPEFLALSRLTGAVLKQNIVLSLALKAVFFVLALLGIATLWMAIFADMGASLLVVFNGLRVLRLGRSEAPPAVAPPTSRHSCGDSQAALDVPRASSDR